MKKDFAVLVTSLVLSGLKEGIATYNAGNHGTAIREFMTAAEQGDARAHYNLGRVMTRIAH